LYWAKHGLYLVNTDISEIDSEISDTLPEEKKSRRGGSALAFLAFVFALAALAGTAWMWWQDRLAQDGSGDKIASEINRLERADSDLTLQLGKIRGEIESMPATASSADIAALQQRLESGAAEVNNLGQTVSEQLALSRSLQSAAEAMQGRLLAAESALAGMAVTELDAGGELDLAEVDYLLRLANERLKLFSEPAAADAALELADMHLAAMDNPMYLGVRQDIAGARRDLAGVVLPDYFAISNDLDSIQESIASLPFKGEAAAPEQPEQEVEAGWWEKVKGVFSNLVTVRRSTDEENKRISLEDKDYIRQRLWLQLEIAHLSLMRRDQQAFHNSLARVQETLFAWFDAGSGTYQSVSNSLEALKGLEVEVEIPDISAPWATLRLIREGRARPAPAIPAEQTQAVSEPSAEESAPREAQG
jgi:uncharacterized protein HemX